jgi:hypothetical protein
MIRKWLAVGIILLFVGVTIAPTINFQVVKASTDDDLIEVTTQACGIQGYRDTTMKLTREQYQNLEVYLVEFRARLNQTTTRDEVVPIFKEAVVELDKYGLLPKGMSVERAQKLVTSMFFNIKNRTIIDKITRRNQNIGSWNIFSLIAGKATYVENFGAFYYLRNILLLPLISFTGDMGVIFWFISEILLDVRSNIFPFYLFGEFCIGQTYKFLQGGYEYYPSTGTIFSLGMLGPRIYSGSFYGQIRSYGPYGFAVGYDTYYSGILGFTGLNIGISGGNFLMGSCLLINLGPTPG